MDLRVSTQPAQSASEKPVTCSGELRGKNKPWPGHCLRYRKTLQAAV